MATARAWDRFVRLALVCTTLGAAVAPARARAAYVEVGAKPAAARVVAAARRPRAFVRPVVAAPPSRGSRQVRVARRPVGPRLAVRRLYVTHRSLLL
jgi:hypothetical protein